MKRLKYVPKRSPDNCVMGFSCSVALRNAIREAAKTEKRTVSNWIVTQLEDLLDEPRIQKTLIAAESKVRYGTETEHSKQAD